MGNPFHYPEVVNPACPKCGEPVLAAQLHSGTPWAHTPCPSAQCEARTSSGARCTKEAPFLRNGRNVCGQHESNGAPFAPFGFVGGGA